MVVKKGSPQDYRPDEYRYQYEQFLTA
jgi:hypothetical protein